jgi:hypothetical protein
VVARAPVRNAFRAAQAKPDIINCRRGGHVLYVTRLLAYPAWGTFLGPAGVQLVGVQPFGVLPWARSAATGPTPAGMQ